MRTVRICWALLLTLACLGSVVQAEILASPISYQKVSRDGRDHVILTNSSSVPVSIKFSLTLDNVSVTGPSDLLEIPAQSSVEGPTFYPTDPQRAWHYNWTYRYNFGSFRIQRPSQPFELPWPRELSFTVGQAFGGDRSHTGDDRYAVDVPMPEGTPIHVARAGLVCYLRDHFSEGRWDPGLRDKDNHVLVAHEDGTISRYLHLRHNGAEVELGQWVEAGELLGYSGNVGFSSGPHLHFDVVRPGLDLVAQTIPFEFLSHGVPVTPQEGMLLSGGSGP